MSDTTRDDIEQNDDDGDDEEYVDPVKTILDLIPKDWPVRPIPPEEVGNYNPRHIATCGGCALSWDDTISTSMTPAPSARCPFENFHPDPEESVESLYDRMLPPIEKLRAPEYVYPMPPIEKLRSPVYHLKHRDSLLEQIAQGCTNLSRQQIAHIWVTFRVDGAGGEVYLYEFDLASALRAIASDLYWDERGDWSEATTALVESP